MSKTVKRFMNWSSGKDCSMALWKLKQRQEQVDLLFTTLNEDERRIGMHGLREELLEAQAEAIGLPLEMFYLPTELDMETYKQQMMDKMNDFKSRGITNAVFGDIFLEDLKKYREEQLNQLEMQAEFPLWKMNTSELIQEFLANGFKAIVVAASARYFDKDFVGTEIDENFLNMIPEEVDPCGENGEFHTFCFDGPIFDKAVSFVKGEKVSRSYPDPKEKDKEHEFYFQDLLLA